MPDNLIERKARLWFAVILFLAAVGTGVGFLLTSHRYTTYRIQTGDAVSGLIRDAPVEFHGVPVGKVAEVRLLSPEAVEILLSIETDAPITTATTAAIIARGLAPRGFTGYVYVALENTGTGSRPREATGSERYPTIPTLPSKEMTLDYQIRRANELIHSLLDETTVNSLKTTLAGVQQIASVLAENDARLQSILANTARASGELKPLLEASGHSIRALQTQVLPEAYKSLRNLEELSQSLNGLATTISRDPSVLLRGTARPSPGTGEAQ